MALSVEVQQPTIHPRQTEGAVAIQKGDAPRQTHMIILNQAVWKMTDTEDLIYYGQSENASVIPPISFYSFHLLLQKNTTNNAEVLCNIKNEFIEPASTTAHYWRKADLKAFIPYVPYPSAREALMIQGVADWKDQRALPMLPQNTMDPGSNWLQQACNMAHAKSQLWPSPPQ